MCKSLTRSCSIGLLLFLAACGEAPEYRFGENITGIQFEIFDTSEGIHPSKVTLQNPRNPFRNYSIGDTTKFDILADGGNAGAFYAWATLLATIPIGENQFYTAVKLRDIYNASEVPEEDLETVREMAVAGFQAVLDCFPESVTYDASGTIPYRLATLAYTEILDLRGVPQGDWVLTPNSRGDLTAVRSTPLENSDREVRCF